MLGTRIINKNMLNFGELFIVFQSQSEMEEGATVCKMAILLPPHSQWLLKFKNFLGH
jgi:hypothetical protein